MILAAFGADSTVTAAAAAAAPSVKPAASIPASVSPAAAVVPVPAAPAAASMPMAATRANRDPFSRPAGGRRGFIPQSLQTQFVPEFDPFPMVMHFPGARVPRGIANPRRAEPGFETPRADPSGQSSLPASVPSPVKMNARMLPPGLVMALGIMPPVRGVRANRVNPMALVAAGRKPTAV